MEKSGGILTVGLDDILLPDGGADHAPNLPAGDYLRLSVADTGCGIAPQIMLSIFDPYFTTKKPGEGTGMGLSVVQGIVEDYGGKITVHSAVGQGTAFTIYLPVVRPESTSTPAPGATAPDCGARILLVDDEAPMAKMSCRILERLGYQVTPQTSGPEALALIQSRPADFDLVIADMAMPYMTGAQLAEALQGIRPGLPVVLCMDYSEEFNERSVVQNGVEAVIYKPIVKDKLAATIRRILDGGAKTKPDHTGR